MPAQPPVLDSRALEDILARLRALAAAHVPEWKPPAEGDAGVALQRIFARLTELALQRLNQVPEKNLLAFLQTMGVSLIPPSPAGVPLTFNLKAGTGPTLVPQGTQAGTLPGASQSAVLFETTEDLNVLPAQIAQAFTMDPLWDRYTDCTSLLAGQSVSGFRPMAGARRMPHVLRLGHSALLDFAGATVDLEPAGSSLGSALQAFFQNLQWQCSIGGVIQSLSPLGAIATILRSAAAAGDTRLTLVSAAGFTIGDTLTIRAGAASVSVKVAGLEAGNVVRLIAPLSIAFPAGAQVTSNPFLRLPVPGQVDSTMLRGPSPVAWLQTGVTSRWIEAVLPAPVTDLAPGEGLGLRDLRLRVSADGLLPDFAFNNNAPLDVTKESFPFGNAPQVGSTLYIGSREAFSKPGVQVTLHADVQPAPPPSLIWEYWNGDSWSRIPNAAVGAGAARTTGPTIDGDGTRGFTVDGAIEIPRPTDISPAGLYGVTAGWFRVRIESGAYSGVPDVHKFSVKTDSAIAAGSTATSLTLADANFAGTGAVLQIGDDNATKEVVMVVAEGGTGAPSVASIAPALRQPHPAGTAVHQRGASAPLAVLRDAVRVGQDKNLPNTFIVNTAAGIEPGDILMIDDPGRREFAVVTDVQPAFYDIFLQASVPTPTATGPVVSPRATGSVLRSDILVGNIETQFNPTVLFPFILGYIITARDRLLFEHAANVNVRRVTSAYFVGFAGATPLDFQSPFYPFGQQPGPSNILYFGVTTGLPRVLHIDVGVEMTSPNVTLQWEILGANGWQAVTPAAVQTDDFVRTGDIVIPPQTYAPGEVNGKSSYWLRVRLASGNYGLPTDYVAVDPADPSKGFTVKPGTASLNPPVIRKLTLGYEARGTPTVVTQDGFTLLDQTPPLESGSIVPFRSVADPGLDVYADAEPAFYVGLTAAPPGEAATLFIATPPSAFSGSVLPEPRGNQVSSAELPPLRWEYFSGAGWQSLTVFDGTNSLTESGTLELLIPEDMAPLARFDSNARYWIRALSAANDPSTTQRIQGVYLNTVPAIQAITTSNEIAGSGSGQPSQALRLTRSPVLPGQRILVREAEPPSDVELAAIVQAEGPDAIETRRNAVTGETETWVTWSEVPNFLRSAPNSRHYTLDRLTGTITFGDGAQGMIPPRGTNNVSASYQAGGGSAGNQPAGAAAQIKSVVSGVASVTNPVAADGGGDVETAAMVEGRGPQTLRHRGRAVSAGDLEWLAREAAGTRVARAKCIPNVNRDLRYEPGWATVLIIPAGTEGKLSPSSQLIGEVEDYLAARAFAGLAQSTPARISVTGPGYIQVSVEAVVVPREITRAEEVKRQVIAAIAAFFHPLTGGPLGTGWEYARDVYESEVYQLLEGVPGLAYVKSLRLIPHIAQHWLSFASPVPLMLDLPEFSAVISPAGDKACLLAEPLAAGSSARAAVKGFKEGDRITKVQDLTVVSASGASLRVAPFGSDGVGFPVGSIVRTYDGNEETRLTTAIRRSRTGLSQIQVDSPDFAAQRRPGDRLTVFYPFPMTVSSVSLTAAPSVVLGIEAYEIDGALAPGTLLATLDNRVRLPLVDGLPANQPFASFTLAGFSTGDTVILSRRDGRFTAAPATVAGIAPAGSVVYLDDNFLVYPGPHRISMEAV